MKLILNNKLTILLGILIVVLYFGLRLPHLTLQPIFADEAIYIRWAQVMRAEPTLRFLPLSDGKTPLFMWALMPLFKFVHDPLLAGRLLSVLAGFFSLLGVFALSGKAFNLKVALWSGLLYTIVPFTLFFDRMALVDSMMAGLTIWAIFLAIWILKSQRLDLSMILGFLLGGAWITKTPAMINLLILPTSIAGFQFKKSFKTDLLKLIGCWLVAIIIGLGIYNSLRLGPGFDELSKRNGDYIFSIHELAGRPLDPFIPHLHDLADFFPKLLTWPVLIFAAIGIVAVIWERKRLGWVVLIWGLIPLLLFTAFLKTFTARYLLMSIPPLLILAGYGINSFIQILSSPRRSSTPRSLRLEERGSSNTALGLFMKWIPAFAGMTGLILVLPLALHFDYLLLTKPESAPLPAEERRGYFEDWTAGYGFKDIANYLMLMRARGPVVVGTEGYFGTLPDGLQIYLDKTDITVIGSGATISAKIKEAAKTNQTFFVANRNRVINSLSDQVPIMVFPKAKPLGNYPQDAIVVYQVKPEK